MKNSPLASLSALRLCVSAVKYVLALLCVSSALAQQPHRDLSADSYKFAQTNLFVVQSTAHRGYAISCRNGTPDTIYLHFFDTNGIPGAGAWMNCHIPVALPTVTQASVDFPYNFPVNQGMVVAASSTQWGLTLVTDTNVAFSAVYYSKDR
jgi:hypothetical protein